MMFADATEERLHDLLTRNYAYLVNHMSVTELMPYLLSEQAITLCDKEVVETCQTSIDRRGKLIETVQRGGASSMQHFMIALEYQEPAVYYQLTKRNARKPPSDVVLVMKRLSSEKRSKNRISISSFRRMKAMIQDLDKELHQTNQTVTHVMSSVRDIQENTSTYDEMDKEWENLETQLDEKTARYSDLSREHVEKLRQLDELQAKYDSLKLENEDVVTMHQMCMKDLQELKMNNIKLQAKKDLLWDLQLNRQSSASSTNPEEVEKLQKTVAKLKHESSIDGEKSKRLNEDLERKHHLMSVMTESNLRFNADMLCAIEERQKLLVKLKSMTASYSEIERELEHYKQQNVMLETKLEELQQTTIASEQTTIASEQTTIASEQTTVSSEHPLSFGLLRARHTEEALLSPGLGGTEAEAQGSVFGSCPRSPKSPQPTPKKQSH